MFAFNKQSNAQTLIHYWHFNNLTWSDTLPNATMAPIVAHPGIFGIDADFSIHDTSKAKILYAPQSGVSSNWPSVSVESDSFTFFDPLSPGTSVNVQMGADTVGSCFRARNPSDSMQLLFYIPTINYESIVLAYACESSGSGMQQQVFDFSADSGATWGTSGLSVTSDSTSQSFSLISVGLSSATANNNSKLVFRIKFNGNTTLNHGNNRFDNVTVVGDSIGAPISRVTPLNANTTTYTLSPNPATASLSVNCSVSGEKNILIYNSLGQSVFTGTIVDKQTSISTANFTSGTYYISIRETATGKITSIPFIKQ